MCVRTILPGCDFIGDGPNYYSCAKSTVHKYSVQILGQLQHLCTSQCGLIFHFFMTLKAGFTLPVVAFVNITHDIIRGQQKSPPCSLHMFL